MKQASKVLYLIPGKTISKKGFPKGKIESKTEYRELTTAEIKIIGNAINNMIAKGTIVDTVPTETETESEKTSGKSDARIALEKEATKLGIDFTDRTSQKDLKAAIEAKKAETATDTEEDSEKTEEELIEELTLKALDLGIDVPDDLSSAEIQALIDAGGAE